MIEVAIIACAIPVIGLIIIGAMIFSRFNKQKSCSLSDGQYTYLVRRRGNQGQCNRYR